MKLDFIFYNPEHHYSWVDYRMSLFECSGCPMKVLGWRSKNSGTFSQGCNFTLGII